MDQSLKVASRQYDGTTAVAATKKTGKDGLTDGGVLGADVVTLTVGAGAFVYASKDADPNKPINIGDKTKFSLTGTGASNYHLATLTDNARVTGFTGTITKRELTVTADAIDRAYNSLTAVTVINARLTGWAATDTALDKTYGNVVSGILVGSVANKNAGVGKAVTFRRCNPKSCNYNL